MLGESFAWIAARSRANARLRHSRQRGCWPVEDRVLMTARWRTRNARHPRWSGHDVEPRAGRREERTIDRGAIARLKPGDPAASVPALLAIRSRVSVCSRAPLSVSRAHRYAFADARSAVRSSRFTTSFSISSLANDVSTSRLAVRVSRTRPWAVSRSVWISASIRRAVSSLYSR
jgi:hypothetical protein